STTGSLPPRWSSSAGDGRLRVRPEIRPPEMNVTPLVDVVLVLLIIFMVVVPQLEAGAAITPPQAQNPDAVDATQEAAVVMVTGQGALLLERTPIAAADLQPTLTDLHKRDPHRGLRIKADRAVRYREVRDVYRTAQLAGFPAAGLEVSTPDEDPR